MILAADLHDAFEKLIDEYESVYFNQSEKDSYLNIAQLDIFEKYVAPVASGVGIPGVDSQFPGQLAVQELLSSLTFPALGESDEDGVIDLLGVFEGNGRRLHSIKSISVMFHGCSNYVPAVHKSPGQIVKQSRMSFFAPNKNAPVYEIKNNSYYIHPSERVDFKATGITYPTRISVQDGINSDFPEIAANQIVKQAVLLAAKATGNTVLINSIKQEG